MTTAHISHNAMLRVVDWLPPTAGIAAIQAHTRFSPVP